MGPLFDYYCDLIWDECVLGRALVGVRATVCAHATYGIVLPLVVQCLSMPCWCSCRAALIAGGFQDGSDSERGQVEAAEEGEERDSSEVGEQTE